MTTTQEADSGIASVKQAIMADMLLSRQSAMIDTKKIADMHFTIVGVGAIGSSALDTLARMGARKFTLYDPDIIESENLMPQNFALQSVGSNKVDAALDMLRPVLPPEYFDTLEVNAFPALFNGNARDAFDVIVVATDTIESRRSIWQKRELWGGYNLYIDARIGGLFYQVFAVNPSVPAHITNYNLALTSSGNPDLPCGEKATAFISRGYVTGEIGKVITRHLRGLPNDFMISHDIETGEIVRIQ